MKFNRAWLPLNGLRAFESTARHLSFTKAADELAVTQSAVSRQVQRLEELLGARLIERRARGIELTPKGERLLAATRECFDGVSRALREIVEHRPREVIRVAAAAAFAHCFAPTLVGGLRQRLPGVELEIDSRWSEDQFDDPAYDLAIIYARPRVTEHVMDLLWEEQVTPLCAPSLLEAYRARRGDDGLDQSAFLADNTLSHIRTAGGAYFAWECWAQAVDASTELVRRGPIFNAATLGVRCALEGEAVVATDPRLYAREIEAGELAAPFASSARTGFGYYLVIRQEDLANESIQAFRSWAIEFFGASAFAEQR